MIRVKEAIDLSQDQLASAARADRIGIAGVDGMDITIVSIISEIMTLGRKRVTIVR